MKRVRGRPFISRDTALLAIKLSIKFKVSAQQGQN